MLIPLHPGPPLTDQIYLHLRGSILDGTLRPGARLPSTRTLARNLTVARNTVVAAYARLVAEGYAEGQGAAGTRVAASIPRTAPFRPGGHGDGDGAPARPRTGRAPRPGAHFHRLLRHASVYPPAALRDEPLPFDFQYNVIVSDRRARRTWNRLLRRCGAAHEASPAPYDLGDRPGRLHAAIARHLEVTRGVGCEPGQVVLLNSAQQAMYVTTRLLLDPGDAVAMETPSRLGAANAFRAHGVRIVPVASDRDGLLVDRLPEDPRVRAVYVSPSHQWPTGATLPLARRLRLLEWAAARGAWIIEHDHNAEYGNWRTPLVSVQGLDDGRRVVYAGTFSRLLSPDPEVAFAVVPRAVVAGFRAAKALYGNWCGVLETEALAAFLEEGHMQSQLRRLERRLRPLRACLLEAIDAMPGRPLVPNAGAFALHVHATIRDFPVDALDALTAECAGAGVGVFPDTRYHLRRPREAGILLGFARMTPEGIREGVRRLGIVLASVRAAPAR